MKMEEGVEVVKWDQMKGCKLPIEVRPITNRCLTIEPLVCLWYGDFDSIVEPLRRGHDYDYVMEGSENAAGFCTDIQTIDLASKLPESAYLRIKRWDGSAIVRVRDALSIDKLSCVYQELLLLKKAYPICFSRFIEEYKNVWEYIREKILASGRLKEVY